MDLETIFWAVVIIIAGVIGFFWGLIRLKKKRIVENIPTSKVRSMAMGVVELAGKALWKHPLYSPLRGSECVYYKYEVEEWKSSGKKSDWVTIASGNSVGWNFYLEDDTGRVLVSTEEAEIDASKSYQFTTSTSNNIPDNIMGFLNEQGIKTTGFLGFSKKLRFTEHYIATGSDIYVIGSATHRLTPDEWKKEDVAALVARLKSIKRNPDIMKLFDFNQDGRVDVDEWEKAQVKIKEEVMLERTLLKEAEEDKLIIKNEPDTPMFYIADTKESAVIRGMLWESVAGIILGPIAVVVGLFILWAEGVWEWFYGNF